jgi:hypothetical protein
MIDFACRNVWTKFNAAVNLKTQLEQWKTATFSVENNGSPLPPGIILWDAVVANVIAELPSQQSPIDVHRVVCAVQQATFAFRDTPGVSSTEPAVVAAFNASWT